MAEIFGLYAHTIMPGLRRTGDRTFVGAFQPIDTAIYNPCFMATFFGALVVTGLTAALHLGAGNRSVLPWVAAVFVLYLVAVVITLAVNVPLNDGIKAAGPPDRIGDLIAVRKRFNGNQVGGLEPGAHPDLHRGVRVPRLGARRVRPELTRSRFTA